MAGELQIVTRVYDLILWTINHTNKFPRDHRFSLGARMEEALYTLLDDVIEGKFTHEKAEILRRAALRLEKIRFQFRLAKDLKILALSSHHHARAPYSTTLVGRWGRGAKVWTDQPRVLNAAVGDDTSSFIVGRRAVGGPVDSPSASWRRLGQQFEELSFRQPQQQPAHQPQHQQWVSGGGGGRPRLYERSYKAASR